MVSKETDYAVRALVNVALEGNSYKSSRKIAKQESIPYPFLRRIISVLKKKGFLLTKEGKDGGVKLKRKPENIRLSDVILSLQGRIDVSKCIFRKKICRRQSGCRLRKKLAEVEKRIISEFKDISIRSLIE